MADIAKNLNSIIKTINEAPPPIPEIIKSDKPTIGDCPLCNTPVRKRGKVYTCDSGQKCSMVIFETVAGRKLSLRMVQNLIQKGSTPKVKGFKSKRTKKTFEAALKLNSEGRVEFDFSNNTVPTPQGSSSSAKSVSSPKSVVGMRCPKCKQGTLIKGRSAWGCGRYKEGCSFVFLFSKATDEQDAIKKIQALKKS